MKEGVIKFQFEKIGGEPNIPDYLFNALNETRFKLYKMDMIGEDEEGIGYGNISVRSPIGTSFYITASQTSGLETISKKHISEVFNVDPQKHFLQYLGMHPSSESISHSAIYSALPETSTVIHIHHDTLWNAAYSNYGHFTPADIDYGSQLMANNISRVAQECKHLHVILMRGHKGGIIVFGDDINEAMIHVQRFKTKMFDQ